MAEAFKNAGLNVTNTETDLYACPASTEAIVKTIRITNVDGTNADDVTVKVTDSGNTKIATIASTINVPADSSLEVAGESIIFLEATDKIRVFGAAASGDLEAFISVVEIS